MTAYAWVGIVLSLVCYFVSSLVWYGKGYDAGLSHGRFQGDQEGYNRAYDHMIEQGRLRPIVQDKPKSRRPR